MCSCVSQRSTVGRSCTVSAEDFPLLNAEGDLFESIKFLTGRESKHVCCHVQSMSRTSTLAPAFLAPKAEHTPPLQFKGCVFVWRNAVGRHSPRVWAGPRSSCACDRMGTVTKHNTTQKRRQTQRSECKEQQDRTHRCTIHTLYELTYKTTHRKSYTPQVLFPAP